MWGTALVLLSMVAATQPADDALRVHVDVKAAGTGAAGRAAVIQQAQRGAVLEVAKGFTGSDDERVFRPLLDQAGAYVQSCEILEQMQNGSQTEAKVEAYVSCKQLRRDLASIVLPLFPRSPKVAAVIAETPSGLPWTSEEPNPDILVAQGLEEAGLEVVQPAAIRAHCSETQMMERLHGDASLAVRFARESLADVAVVGEATVVNEPAKQGSNLIPCRATITVRVLRAVDAKICEVLSAEAVVHSTDTTSGAVMAMTDACMKLQQDLLVAVVLAVAGTKSSDSIVLTVTGLKTNEQWQELCTSVKAQPGVGEVEELYFGEGNGRAKVEYSGELAPLVDSLTAEDFSGFRLEPERVVGRDMTMGAIQ